MIYLELFLSFLKVGLFSVGGGYAAMPLIQNQVVSMHAWLTNAEFADLVAIAEMTPGPIALNGATFVGLRMGGSFGAIIASIGCITPSLIIVSVLAKLYMKFRSSNAMEQVLSCLRPAVIALIAGALFSILNIVAFSEGVIALEGLNPKGIILFLLAFFAIVRLKASPVLTMLACGGINLIYELVMRAV
ncbi:MAG: chromate transporter [Clostridia bacterium]|nr:chromate transporter [Clostridia bacterium]